MLSDFTKFHVEIEEQFKKGITKKIEIHKKVVEKHPDLSEKERRVLYTKICSYFKEKIKDSSKVMKQKSIKTKKLNKNQQRSEEIKETVRKMNKTISLLVAEGIDKPTSLMIAMEMKSNIDSAKKIYHEYRNQIERVLIKETIE